MNTDTVYKEPGEEPLQPPPSYKDVERHADPPPSYESLFAKAKAVRQISKGNLDFVRRITTIFLASLAFTVLLAVMLAIPVAMIVIGAKYLHDCPGKVYIPIYILVLGILTAARCVFAVVRRCCREEDKGKTEKEIFKVINGLLFGGFIAGLFMIYLGKGTVVTSDPTAPHFCHPTLYFFGLAVFSSLFVLLGCCCCFVAVCSLFAACLNGGSEDEPQDRTRFWTSARTRFWTEH